jgi:hypothetical protein
LDDFGTRGGDGWRGAVEVLRSGLLWSWLLNAWGVAEREAEGSEAAGASEEVGISAEFFAVVVVVVHRKLSLIDLLMTDVSEKDGACLMGC